MINIKNLSPVEASYIDPHGRLFKDDHNYFRIIYENYISFFENMFSSGLINDLENKKLIIKSDKIDNLGQNSLIIRHKKIEPISYPMEWSPSMLKDAALLTLNLAEELLTHSLSLQDGSPYNILFDFSDPLFVDLTSICPIFPNTLWKPFEQFLRLFYFPLILYSHGSYYLGRNILYNYYNGIDYEEIRTVMSTKCKIKNIFLLEIPFFINRYNQKLKYSDLSKFINNQIRRRFIVKIKRKIENIRIKQKRTYCTSYYNNGPEFEIKYNIIKNIFSEIKPKNVLDIGSNIGIFSFLAAENGSKVVSIDNSWECIDHIYLKLKSKKLNILPLCIDILNPTPSFGWNLNQYEDFFCRLRSEFVLMLALIHHLILKQWQNFERVIKFAAKISTNYLLIEFVDKKDIKIKQMNIDIPDWYNLEILSKSINEYFFILKKEHISNTRTILLCKKK